MGTVGLIEHLAVADSAIREARSLLDDGVDSAVLIAARALVDQAELLCTLSAAQFSLGAGPHLSGGRDVGGWMAVNTNARAAEGPRRVVHANLLSQFCLLNAAAESGAIGVAHVQMFAAAFTSSRVELAERDEEVLVDWAVKLPIAQFGQVLKQWESLCDDELGDSGGEDRIHAKRSLQVHQLPDGSWSIRGVLDTLGGETIKTALEAAMTKPADDDPRSIGQRRHDALVDIASGSLSISDRASSGGDRPHVTITVTSETGQARTGIGMVYLSSFTRDMLLCDSVKTVVCSLPNGVPFDVGDPEAAIPMRTRRAVMARDTTCRYPGCSHPARWNDIHHIKYRRHGGNNDINNLVSLCRYHHRLTHRLGLTLAWDTDGITLTIEWADGTKTNSPPTPKFKRNRPS